MGRRRCRVGAHGGVMSRCGMLRCRHSSNSSSSSRAVVYFGRRSRLDFLDLVLALGILRDCISAVQALGRPFPDLPSLPVTETDVPLVEEGQEVV